MGDILEVLGPDSSTNILSFLDDPADLIRATSVSRSWRQFVIENGFIKKLCLKLFPELSTAAHAIEVEEVIQSMPVGSSDSKAVEISERNHKVYAILARGLSSTLNTNCISHALSATSTDNYPEESIRNTLEPRDIVEERASYWSSKGESDAGIPERLTYSLISDLSFITEIKIQPFQAYFQYGFPIYSAKAVRFRMGHLKPQLQLDLMDEGPTDDCFNWTYVSPIFPMTQEYRLQTFKLPESVLCLGGTLQVELLGRVQRQEMDGLYYICVSHVQAVGRTLSAPFGVKFSKEAGKSMVSYSREGENSASSGKKWEIILANLLGWMRPR